LDEPLGRATPGQVPGKEVTKKGGWAVVVRGTGLLGVG